MNTLVQALYSAVMWCAQPLLRLKISRRGTAEPGYLVNIEERFGQYDMPAVQRTSQDQQFVWVHAVSLGETRAAAVLVAALRETLPGMKLLFTHGTATGREEGQKILRNGDVQVWQAWDTVAATARFIQHFKPKIGIMMETELWPNMAVACSKFKVPLVIANARMSEKTHRKTSRFSSLARPAYESLTAVWPQSVDDAARFTRLGAPVKTIFGNLKFDAQVDATQLALGQHWRLAMRQPVVMLASSREGEELQLLQYLQKSRPTSANVQWLIVPRHPQRFADVEALIKQYGFDVSKRSDWLEQPTLSNNNKTIWLGNSLAEMALYYGMSDVAMLGGSFEPLGGQNLIEAAACGCPVVMGPSTFNFATAAEYAIASKAAFQSSDFTQAMNVVYRLIEDAEALKAAKIAALKFAASHQGAAKKTALAIQQLIG
jgi:3-deoxy-D-manno-octulosonic-acid transferase